jgi:phasin family protein
MAVKQNVKTAKDTVETMTLASNEAVRQGVDRTMAAFSEMSAFGKENIEAVVAAATATTKGVETLNARAAAYTKTSLEGAMAATRAMSASKSFQELMEKQAEFTKGAVDAYLAELNSMTEIFASVQKDAIKPLSDRMTTVASTVTAARTM